MLKKAGIVVAATTAGLLALSPLAFATSHDQEHHRPHGGHSPADVAQTTVERDDQNVDCDFRNNRATTGAGGLLGTDLGTPIDATVPILSCNNADFEDVADLGTNDPNTEIASTR